MYQDILAARRCSCNAAHSSDCPHLLSYEVYPRHSIRGGGGRSAGCGGRAQLGLG